MMLNIGTKNIHEARQMRASQIIGVKLAFVLLVGILIVSVSAPSWADDARDARDIVTKAEITADSFRLDPNLYPEWRGLLREAKAVLIMPQIIKGGLILGGSGGSGVLLARDKNSGNWNGPAFYTIGGVSFGLLAGAQVAETIIVVRTERGLNGLLNTGAKLGADLSITAGPVGAGVGAGNITADLVVLSRSKGLYGGLSLEGSIVDVRDSLNTAYYGKSVTPSDIVILGSVKSSKSDSLISAVRKLTGGK
jgi:lipid-binding SYLF domain-containing protein